MFLTHFRALPAASQLPRQAKAWKFKRPGPGCIKRAKKLLGTGTCTSNLSQLH